VQERRAFLPALNDANGSRRRWARRLLIPAVATAVVVVDQLTKAWALHHTEGGRHVVGPIWLALTFNSGAAFSLGRGVTPVVEAVVVVLVVWLLASSRRASRAASAPRLIGFGLLLGGAIGNLIDRVFRHHGGAVIDFIDALRIGSHSWWPVFNVADAAIVIGVVVLLITYLWSARATAGPESADRRGTDAAPDTEGPNADGPNE
jgi:signal peptidase II